jgi:hypothetical protein
MCSHHGDDWLGFWLFDVVSYTLVYDHVASFHVDVFAWCRLFPVSTSDLSFKSEADFDKQKNRRLVFDG